MVKSGKGFIKQAHKLASGKRPTIMGYVKWFGKDVLAKITPNDDLKTATVRISQKYMKDGQARLSTFEGTVQNYKLKQTADGRVEIGYVGQFVKDSTRTIVNTALRFTGTSRMEVGFDSLMGQLKMNGVSDAKIKEFTAKWELLTDAQKVEFFALYHKSNLVVLYGSDAIHESKMDTTVEDYAELIEECLDDCIKVV